jgi:hypothetical protein
MRSFYEARRFRIVGKGFADLTDGDFQHRVAHKRIPPDGADQIFLGHKLSRTGEQVFEYGEGFGPELNGLQALPETLVHRVEREGSEMNATFSGHGITVGHPSEHQPVRSTDSGAR